MVGGRFIPKLNTNYLVISLALAFVLYHLAQFIVAPVMLASSILFQTSPVIQPKPTPPISVVATPTASLVKLGQQVDPKLWPTRIKIGSVGLDLPLEGSIENNGSWNISLTGADFAINTAVPNPTAGNTTLFGHDRPLLFRPIHDTKVGDQILVYAPDGVYAYTITGNTVVEPSDISIFNQTPTPTLTLITCNGWFSENRFVVFAKLTRVESLANHVL